MQAKKAFSLLELILIICIIAIISSFAIPHFKGLKQDSNLLKLKADIAIIQSALAYTKNEFILKNINTTPSVLDEAKIGLEKQALFFCTQNAIDRCQKGVNCCQTSILTSPIYSSKKAWMKLSATSYRFYLTSKSFVDFVYEPSTMSFECVDSELCKELL